MSSIKLSGVCLTWFQHVSNCFIVLDSSWTQDTSRYSAVFQLKFRQELQIYKDEVERLSAAFKQCAEHGKGSKETLEKSMAELAQKHEQTKAMLSKSQHHEMELQAQIAEVQSARVSLQDKLSKQQAENASLKEDLQGVKAEDFSRTSQDWHWEAHSTWALDIGNRWKPLS